MKITKVTLADVPELTDLINSAYRGEVSKIGWTSEAHLLDGTRITPQMIHDYLQEKAITILKLTDEVGKIIGTVYLELKREQLYLGMLSVSPFVQNKRAGRTLLEEAERFALINHCNQVIITVISSRIELINWYERRGFIKTGGTEPFPDNVDVGQPKEPLELIEMKKFI